MKKIALLIVLLAFFASCKTSKKGAWVEKDKKAFIEGCEGEIKKMKDTPDGKTVAALVNLEEFGKKSCECALKKIEESYKNPTQAEKDKEGTDKIAQKCGADIMLELMNQKK
jgi:hypothetical protein